MEPEVRNKLDLAIEIRDVYAREILDLPGIRPLKWKCWQEEKS